MDPDMYDEGWNPQDNFNSLLQPYIPALNFKNPAFKLWALMMKKILLEHANGASIIGLATDDNLKNETFIKYILPVAKIYNT
jgi:hypothetical protein